MPKCRGCGREIEFVHAPGGRAIPKDRDGADHLCARAAGDTGRKWRVDVRLIDGASVVRALSAPDYDAAYRMADALTNHIDRATGFTISEVPGAAPRPTSEGHKRSTPPAAAPLTGVKADLAGFVKAEMSPAFQRMWMDRIAPAKGIDLDGASVPTFVRQHLTSWDADRYLQELRRRLRAGESLLRAWSAVAIPLSWELLDGRLSALGAALYS